MIPVSDRQLRLLRSQLPLAVSRFENADSVGDVASLVQVTRNQKQYT